MAFLGSILWSKLLSPTWQSQHCEFHLCFKHPRCYNPRPANLPCNHSCACNNQVELLVRRDVDTHLIRGDSWPYQKYQANNLPGKTHTKKQQPFCWNRVSGMLGPAFFDVKFCLHIGLKLLSLQTMWKMAAQVKVVYLPAAVFRRK